MCARIGKADREVLVVRCQRDVLAEKVDGVEALEIIGSGLAKTKGNFRKPR